MYSTLEDVHCAEVDGGLTYLVSSPLGLIYGKLCRTMADYSPDIVVLGSDEYFHFILLVGISCAIKEWRSVNGMSHSHKTPSRGRPHC